MDHAVFLRLASKCRFTHFAILFADAVSPIATVGRTNYLCKYESNWPFFLATADWDRNNENCSEQHCR